MLCRHGKHTVGLRINILRICTEQQTIQVLTQVVIHTHFRQVTKVLPATSTVYL